MLATSGVPRIILFSLLDSLVPISTANKKKLAVETENDANLLDSFVLEVCFGKTVISRL